MQYDGDSIMFSSDQTSTQFSPALRFHRELGIAPKREASRFNETFARKLSVENVLQGHEGCVNRLAWNEEGTLLASGSDDRRVLLWHYPDSNLAPVVLKTPHLANIFGVRILPCSGNRRIVTGAMDCSVQLHVLDASPSTYARAKREQRTVRWVPDEGNEPVPLHTTKYLCHSKRVKGVEVAPRDPHVFWSVSEDGDVRQFDTRSRTSTQDEEESPNVLLSLKRSSAADDVELKCMAINKVRPNEMAVGAHDQYIRIFDRRMLCTGPPRSARVYAKPMLMLGPPHLCLGDKKRGRSRQHTTGVSFGARGDKVVASYHGDHAYSFDITRSSQEAAESALAYPAAPSQPHLSRPAASNSHQEVCSSSGRGDSAQFTPCTLGSEMVAQLSKKAEGCKSAGNHAYFEKDFAKAVRLYSDAIHYAPGSALLYSNRSAALLGRGWQGDAWFALQDSEQALRINASSSKAVYRRIQALRALGLLEEAAASMEQFEGEFPDMQKDAKRLRETIEEDLAEVRKKAELRRTQSAARRRAQAEMRQNAARHRRRQTDATADSNGAVAATAAPRPPTPRPPVNPFLEASMHLAEAGPAAGSPAASSAAQQADLDAGAELGRRPGREEAFTLDSARSGEGTRSDGPSALLTGPTRQQPSSAREVPSHQDSDEVVPGPPSGSPPGPGGDFQAGSAATRGSVERTALDRALLEYRQHDNGDAGASNAQDSRLPWEDNSAGGHGMDVDTNRGEVGDGVFNLPADVWEADSGAESDDEPMSEDDTQMDEHELEVEVLRDKSSYAAFSTASVPEGRRLLQRYMGHCNIQTDIKEVTFLGDNDELVAAGSDDGRIFIYAAKSGLPIVALEADEDVANCVAPHPSLPVLATSGIESAVRLWSPKGPAVNPDLSQEVAANQDRMRAGPSFGARLNPRLLAAITQNPELLQVIMSRTRVAGLSSEQELAGAEQDQDGPGACSIS